MTDFYRDDLLDFVRYGRLDAYELTDDALHVRPSDVVHRRYWRQLSPHTFEDRKRLDDWW